MSNDNATHDLFEEALASLEMENSLERYSDAQLAEIAQHCEKLLQVEAAIDLWGNVIGVPAHNWREARAVQRAVLAERRCRIADR